MARLARLLWIWLVIFALAAAAAWFADHPGEVSISWLGYRADTSMAILLLLLLTASVIFVWFDRLRRLTVRRIEGLFHFMARLRARRAQDALVRGLVAAASGDAAGAKRHLAQAERGKPDPRLLLLLRAQSARLSGDRSAAEDAFTAMLDSADTRGLGLSGLMAEARARGDDERFRELTAQAHGAVMRARGLFEAAFEGEVLAGRWKHARELVRDALRHRVVGPEAAARMGMVLLTAEARDLRAAGEERKATGLLRRALRVDPAFTPAAVLAAEIESGRNHRRRAERIIEAAWAGAPHPDLGRLYADLAKDREPGAMLAHIRALASLKPSHPESGLIVARHALAAHRAPMAEDALAPLLTPEPTARVCNALAEAAQAVHGRAAGQSMEGWLARAARAPRDGFWRCGACGRETATWEPLCSRCRTFDSLRWAAGVEAAEAAAKTVELAPKPAASGRKAPPAAVAARPAPAAALPGPAAARRARPRGPVDPAIHIPTRLPDDPGPETEDEQVVW